MGKEFIELKVFINKTTNQASIILPKKQLKSFPATISIKKNKRFWK